MRMTRFLFNMKDKERITITRVNILRVGGKIKAQEQFRAIFPPAMLSKIGTDRILITIGNKYLYIYYPDIDTKKSRKITLNAKGWGICTLGNTFYEDITGDYIFDEEDQGKLYFNKI